ncbi:MAG: MotA/TolQ/ExbB proton channel family protein [Balneolaceae bacterium]|nr:MotA/TolQ/ExbB proton channel family protein [Balneolaceae bacterium]
MSLFYEGGLFMGILTLLLLVILSIAVYRAIQISKNDVNYETTFRQRLTYIKSLGIFTLVMGILGQLLGLYQAFSVIEQAGNISPAILAGGLKVSLIPTLYGIVIFLLSYLIWMGLDYMVKKPSVD